MPLKELIIKDLKRIAKDPTAVATEESMSFLIHIYHEKYNKLINPAIVGIADLPLVLASLSKRATISRQQLFIEHNSRNLANPDNPIHNGLSVHYGASDVFCDTKGNLIVLNADHYRGKEYNYEDFNKCFQKKTPVLFVNVGGAPYQNDSSHCPIFTLQHLLATAEDSELENQLRQFIAENLPFTLVRGEKDTQDVESHKKVYYSITTLKNKPVFSYEVMLQGESGDSSFWKKGSLSLHSINPNFDENVSDEALNQNTLEILFKITQKIPLQLSINMHWNQLGHAYNVHPQSISQLTKYVDTAMPNTPEAYNSVAATHYAKQLMKNIKFFDSNDIDPVFIRTCKAKILSVHPNEQDIQENILVKNWIYFVKTDNHFEMIYCDQKGKAGHVTINETFNSLFDALKTYKTNQVISNPEHLRQILKFTSTLPIVRKPINQGIENLTSEFANFGITSLELEDDYTEQKLITICYKKRYGLFANTLLESYSTYCNELAKDGRFHKIAYHAITEYVFSNQFFLNIFSNTSDKPKEVSFKEFLRSEPVLKLIAIGYIKIEDLINKIAERVNNTSREINTKYLRILHDQKPNLLRERYNTILANPALLEEHKETEEILDEMLMPKPIGSPVSVATHALNSSPIPKMTETLAETEDKSLSPNNLLMKY